MPAKLRKSWPKLRSSARRKAEKGTIDRVESGHLYWLSAPAGFSSGVPRVIPGAALGSSAGRQLEFPKIGKLGAWDRSAVFEHYEQRESDTTSPRHGHPARGPAIYDI